MRLTTATVLAALVCLAVEVPEGADADALLTESCEEYGLDRDQFLTEPTLFSLGYHRALAARPFDDSQVPLDGDKPSKALAGLVEDGYAFGLEARELSAAPPASVVYEAFKAGKLAYGSLSSWAAGLDLKSTFRLGAAVEVGSGKNAQTIPAGTPIDILGRIEKDGVDHVIASYDGVALLIPNPAGDPKVVSGDTVVAPARKARAASKKAAATNADGSPKAPKEKVERGPTLKGVIVDVIEGNEGGEGPLQTNGQFAGRVLKLARERGIGDKAGKFMQKADKHVPYYLNCYKPETKDGIAYTGRLGVESPKVAVIAAIESRKYFLKAEGDSAARKASIPAELRAKMDDKAATLTTVEPPASAKKADAVEGAEA